MTHISGDKVDLWQIKVTFRTWHFFLTSSCALAEARFSCRINRSCSSFMERVAFLISSGKLSVLRCKMLISRLSRTCSSSHDFCRMRNSRSHSYQLNWWSLIICVAIYFMDTVLTFWVLVNIQVLNVLPLSYDLQLPLFLVVFDLITPLSM